MDGALLNIYDDHPTHCTCETKSGWKRNWQDGRAMRDHPLPAAAPYKKESKETNLKASEAAPGYLGIVTPN